MELTREEKLALWSLLDSIFEDSRQIITTDGEGNMWSAGLCIILAKDVTILRNLYDKL